MGGERTPSFNSHRYRRGNSVTPCNPLVVLYSKPLWLLCRIPWCGRASHDYAPDQEKDADGEKGVHPSRGFGGEGRECPDGEHGDRGENAEVHVRELTGQSTPGTFRAASRITERRDRLFEPISSSKGFNKRVDVMPQCGEGGKRGANLTPIAWASKKPLRSDLARLHPRMEPRLALGGRCLRAVGRVLGNSGHRAGRMPPAGTTWELVGFTPRTGHRIGRLVSAVVPPAS